MAPRECKTSTNPFARTYALESAEVLKKQRVKGLEQLLCALEDRQCIAERHKAQVPAPTHIGHGKPSPFARTYELETEAVLRRQRAKGLDLLLRALPGWKPAEPHKTPPRGQTQ